MPYYLLDVLIVAFLLLVPCHDKTFEQVATEFKIVNCLKVLLQLCH